MKICMLTSMHPPEDGRIFHKEAASLAKKYDVSLIAPADSIKSYSLKGVSLTTVKKPNSRIFHLVTLFRLYRAAVKEDADIYHCHEPDALYIALLIKRFEQKIVVYDVHEHWPSMAALTAFGSIGPKIVKCKPLDFFIQRLTESIELSLAKKADLIITVSDSVAERFTRIGLGTHNIMNVPVATFKVPDNTEKDPYCVVYVCGKLGFSKGIDIAIKSLAQLAMDYPSIHLTLVGDVRCDTLGEIDSGLKSRVTITGFLPYEKMYEKISECGIGLILFQNTHYNSYIGLPNKLFDYMMCGIPVVASDFPEIGNVVRRADCGELVDTDNVESIVKGIKYLLDNPQEAQGMGDRGRKAIDILYNWNEMEKRLLEVYVDLLSKGHDG